MLISELIEMLEDMKNMNGDREVRIASQENWPFEHSLQGVVDGRDLREEDQPERPVLEDLSFNDLCQVAEKAGLSIPEDGSTMKRRKILMGRLRPLKAVIASWIEENFDLPPEEDNPYKEFVYLVEGTQLGYFTKNAWEQC